MYSAEINKARAFIYKLLSDLFVEEYTKTNTKELLNSLEVLQENSFSQEVSIACGEILDYLKEKGEEYLYKEYQEMFLIPFGTFIPLSVSWYYEQREGGIMQLRVKEVLAKTKIRKDEKNFTAQEDHYGFIFTLSAYLLEQEINDELEVGLQKELFEKVINSTIDGMFFKLIGSPSYIYSRVGAILQEFIGFERAYFEINT